MARAVSSLSLCGRDEIRSELENAMPCFFGLRTRVISDRDVVYSSPGMTLVLSSTSGTWSGREVVATCGSSSLSSLPALLRKTLRRLLARKVGPLAVSSMIRCTVQAAIAAASIC